MGQSHTKQHQKPRKQIGSAKHLENAQQQNMRSSPPKNKKNDIVAQVFNRDALEQKLEEFCFPDPHIKYKIVPIKSEKMALDVCTVDDEKNDLQQGNMIIWDYHGGPNQQFYLKKLNQRKYQIINVATNFALGVPNRSTEDKVVIGCCPCQNQQTQQWQLIRCGNNKHMFRIESFCKKSLTIKDYLIRNGTDIIQYKWQDKKNQKWMIFPG